LTFLIFPKKKKKEENLNKILKDEEVQIKKLQEKIAQGEANLLEQVKVITFFNSFVFFFHFH